MNPQEVSRLKHFVMKQKCPAHNFNVSVSPNSVFNFTCCCRDMENEVNFIVNMAMNQSAIDLSQLSEALRVRRKHLVDDATMKFHNRVTPDKQQIFVNGKWWTV